MYYYLLKYDLISSCCIRRPAVSWGSTVGLKSGRTPYMPRSISIGSSDSLGGIGKFVLCTYYGEYKTTQ